MGDPFSNSCGPTTSDGYIRGTDETLTENEGAGAAPAPRREATCGRGKPGGGRPTGRRLAADGHALGSSTRGRGHGGVAPRDAFRAPGAAQRDAAQRAGASAEGWK